MRTLVLARMLAATAMVLAAPLAAQPIADGPRIPLYSSDSEKGLAPVLAAAPDGGFAAVWTRQGDLLARVFRADGAALTPVATLISPDDGFDFGHGFPKIAALSTGGYAVAWTRGGPLDQLAGRLRILDATGQPAGPVLELGSSEHPWEQVFVDSITADATGHFVVGWSGSGDTVVQRFGADGTPATPEIMIPTEPSTPEVAAFPDGRFVVGWMGTERLDFVFHNLLAQLYGPAGNALGLPFAVRATANDRSVYNLRISALADRFATVWTETFFTTPADRIVARLWDANGLPLGPEIVVAETAQSGQSVGGGQVAMRSDGSFLVLWMQEATPLVRLFDPQGRPVGEPLPILVSSGVGASDVEAAGHGWWVASPVYDLSVGPTPANAPWAQRLVSSCGTVSGPGLCLGGRFRAEVAWRVPGIAADGIGSPLPQTDDTGAFWFFAPGNYELLVKVLDGRGVNGHYWVFYGALTDVEFDLTVTDLATGKKRTYHNPAGTMASRADTVAF